MNTLSLRLHEAAELYLQSNMAKVLEENNLLRESLADTTANSIIKVEELEKDVTVLKKALEEISLHTDMPDSPTEQLVNKIANQTLQSIITQ